MSNLDFDTYYLGRRDPRQMLHYRNGLARRQNSIAPVKIAIIGDSRVSGSQPGYDSVLNNSKCWPTQMGNLFIASGMPVNNDCFVTHHYPNVATTDARVTNSGWTLSTLRSAAGGMFTSATAGNKLSFTPTKPFNTVTVIGYGVGGGSCTVDVDGGASLGTITSNAGSTLVTTNYTVPVGSLTVNLTTVTGTIVVAAVFTSLSTEYPARIFNLGWQGSKINDWVLNPTTYGPIKFVQNLAPHLTIVELGINDAIQVTDLTSFQNDYQTLITALQAAGTGDVALVVPVSVATSVQPDSVQTPYFEAIRSLAITNNCQLYDVQRRWVNYANIGKIGDAAPVPGWYAETIHPASSGYWDYAQGAYHMFWHP